MGPSPIALRNRLLGRARLRHLQALSRLVDLRSMGRAAQALGISQPAMSQLVADLEALMEIRLFRRHAKGVEPTALAISLASMAQRMLGEVDGAAELVASQLRRDSSLVRIAASAAAAYGVLARALTRFDRVCTGVQLHVVEVAGPALDASFSNDDFEVVCCRWPETPPEGWHFEACLADESVIVCGAGHDGLRRMPVTPETLRRACWLLAPMSTVARQHYETYIVDADGTRPPELSVITREVGVMRALLRERELLTLLPRSLAQPFVDDGTMTELQSPLRMPLPPLGVFWRPATAQLATRTVVAHLLRCHGVDGAAGLSS